MEILPLLTNRHYCLSTISTPPLWIKACVMCSSFMVFLKTRQKNVCVCPNSTLDQVSLCTPGRLNNVAPWPVPPALGADSPDPEAPLSLFTLLSLILLWSLSSLACPLLYMACWPAPQPRLPPCHHSSEIQFHHTKSHHQQCAPGDSCIKLSVFLQLAAVRVFQPSLLPGLWAAKQCYSLLLSFKRKHKSSVRWQWG